MDIIDEQNHLLDKILTALKDGNAMNGEELMKYVPILKLSSLLYELEKDNYIKSTPPHHREITPSGVEFISKGGYTKNRSVKENKERVFYNSYKWTKIGVWVAVVLGIENLLYMILHDFFF